MDLVLCSVVSTGPVALMGIASPPIAFYLLEMEMRQVLNAGVEVVREIVLAQPRDTFYKFGWCQRTREGRWGGEMRNSHDGGCGGTQERPKILEGWAVILAEYT